MPIYTSRVTNSQRHPRSSARRTAAAFVAAALAISACGAAEEDAADESTTTTAALVTDESTVEDAPVDDETETTEATTPDATDADEATAPATDAKSSRLGDRVLVSDLAVTSGRFEGRITISGGDDLPSDIELVLTGAFDSANEASELSMDLGAVALAAAEQEGTDLGPMAAMFEEPMIIRTIGNRSFISWGLLSLLTGTNGGWLETEADSADDFTSSFGATGNGSPVDLLQALEDANAEITELGTEDIRGVSTTHIRAIIDIEEYEAGLSDDERATIERDLGSTDIDNMPIEFWIDEDGLVRRYSIDLTEAAAGEADVETAGLVFEFFDYGADVDIAVPPADQIISADELDLEGFGFGN